MPQTYVLIYDSLDDETSDVIDLKGRWCVVSMGENVISVLSTRTRKLCLTFEIQVLDEVPANLVKLELSWSGVIYCLFANMVGSTEVISADIRSKEQNILDIAEYIEVYSEAIKN